MPDSRPKHTFRRSSEGNCEVCGERYTNWRHYYDHELDWNEADDAACTDCGEPFNNANPSPSGLCRACEA